MHDNVCLSGGAIGADSVWGQNAILSGHDVIHFSFKGHKSSVPLDQLVILTDDQLSIADRYLKQASKTLKRSFPCKWTLTNNLLRRNFYQIETSNSLYAISSFKNNQVEGGTAWAVQMFIDMNGTNKPCYVFDQNENKWYSWESFGWVHIDKPPKPQGIWTGIGTRKLNGNGLNEIINVFN